MTQRDFKILSAKVEALEHHYGMTTAEMRELFRSEAIAVTLLGNLGAMKIERADLVC